MKEWEFFEKMKRFLKGFRILKKEKKKGESQLTSREDAQRQWETRHRMIGHGLLIGVFVAFVSSFFIDVTWFLIPMSVLMCAMLYADVTKYQMRRRFWAERQAKSLLRAHLAIDLVGSLILSGLIVIFLTGIVEPIFLAALFLVWEFGSGHVQKRLDESFVTYETKRVEDAI